MNYIFREKESYLYDALLFPGMIYYEEEDIKNSEDNYNEYITESSIAMIKEMHDLIMPFEDEVRKFYFKGGEERHFIQLLMVSNPILGEYNPVEYLKNLEKKSEKDLLFEAIYALDYFDQDMERQDKQASELIAKNLVDNQEKVMPWINGLSINNDSKWQLYSFMQDPKKVLESYVALMMEIIPIFDKFYEKYRENVIVYGENFIERLYATEGDSLSSLSNGLISESILGHQGDMDILISLTYSLGIMLNTASVKPYITWGYEVENVFLAIKDHEANQIVERVTFFKNLGDKTRYEVLMNIAKGITSTKIIAKNLSVSSATISYHLNNLVTAKLIYLAQIEGKYTYKVNEEVIKRTFDGFMRDLENLQ